MLSLTSSVFRRCCIVSAAKHLNPIIISRPYTKNYDKRILLEPESVEYKFEDERFLRGPSWADEPYLKPTEEEILELTRVKLEREVAMEVKERVDPNVAPFNAVLENVDDGGKFTGVERIP